MLSRKIAYMNGKKKLIWLLGAFMMLFQIFTTKAFADEFVATFRSIGNTYFCWPQVASIGLFDKDGNRQALILNQTGNSGVDFSPYLDNQKFYIVSGSFYKVNCFLQQTANEYFNVEHVENAPATNSLCANVTEITASQCDALVDLFNSTNGEAWKNKTNWLETETPSDWHGVTVRDGNVIHLNLSNNNLQGELPETIGNLSHLDYLNLSDNQLSGKIPDSVGTLSELIQLWMGGNQLDVIPVTIGGLSKLTHLDLHLNQISNLPPQIGELTRLTYLNLHSNQLKSESIPDEMSQLLALESVSLHNNQLSGDVLNVISKWKNLWGLDLSWNPLEELLPEIGQLTKLRTLKLHKCQLEQLPNEMGEMTQLADLNLMNNLLTADSFPAEFADLDSLVSLSLHNNSLERLPEPVSLLKNLKGIDLSWNKPLESLDGIGDMTSLEILKLHSTDLTVLPGEMSTLTNLKELWLSGNQFTQFPMVVTELTSLEKLFLTYNPQLTGELPADLTNLTQMKEFTFDGTDLCIPQNADLQEWLNNIPTVKSSDNKCACGSELESAILALQVVTGHNVNSSCADVDQNGKVELRDALIALRQASASTAPGILRVKKLIPENGTLNYPTDISFCLSFNQNIVKANSGSIHIIRKTDNSVVERLEINSERIVIINNNLFFRPSEILEEHQEYYIEIDDQIVKDKNGQLFSGLSGSNSWSFETASKAYATFEEIKDQALQQIVEKAYNNDSVNTLLKYIDDKNSYKPINQKGLNINGSYMPNFDIVFLTYGVGGNTDKLAHLVYANNLVFENSYLIIPDDKVIYFDKEGIIQEISYKTNTFEKNTSNLKRGLFDDCLRCLDSCNAILAGCVIEESGKVLTDKLSDFVLGKSEVADLANQVVDWIEKAVDGPDTDSLLDAIIWGSELGFDAAEIVGIDKHPYVAAVQFGYNTGKCFERKDGSECYDDCFSNECGDWWDDFWSWGDPHIVTLDGLKYNFQISGEVLYLESIENPNEMTIQARQEPYGDHVSVNTAVAISVLGDIIEIYKDLANNSSVLYINRQAEDVSDTKTWELPNGGILHTENNLFMVIWPDYSQIRVRSNKKYLDIQGYIAPSRKGALRGLAGNYDDNLKNDLMTRDGNIQFKTNLTKEELYGIYGKSWRVSESESLFMDSIEFDENFPEDFMSVDDLDPQAYESAKAECESAGITDPILLDACILDFAVTQDAEFINSAADAPIPQKRVNDGLYAYFSFDGNSDDQSGMDNHGTVFGATLAEGYKGQAYQFDGEDDYIDVPLNINPDEMPQLTIGAWVKASDETRIQQIISHDSGGHDRSLCIDNRGGGWGWSAFAGNRGVLGFAPISIKTWTFVAVVYDQSAKTVILYVDGDIYTKENASLGIGYKNLYIGENPDPAYVEYFKGSIDEVFIFSKVLTREQLDNIRANGLSTMK